MKQVEDKNPGTDEGLTPLHEAAEMGHMKICELILKNIQDKMLKTISGKTPHMAAFENNHLELAHYLRGKYFYF